MSRTANDADIIRILRVFVAATRPVLAALKDPELLELNSSEPAGGIPGRLREKVASRISTVRPPSASATVQERADWWVRRVGVVTSVLAAAPGVSGAVTEKLPLKDALAAAGQGLVLCGIASEYGMQETDEQVQLLAAVLLHREVDPTHFPLNAQQIQDEAAESINELQKQRNRPTITAMARTLWKLGRTLSSLSREFHSHQQNGKRKSRLIGKLPGVDAVKSFLVERSNLEDVARAAHAWLAARG